MKKNFNIQKMITVGVYTAVYFFLVGVATFASTILLPVFGVILLPGLCALITGAVYLLLIKKTRVFGAITSMGIVMGLFFLLVGHFALSFFPHLISAFTADLVAKKGNYLNQRLNKLSFILFSFGITGPVLPLWFFKGAYIQSLEGRGKDATYIAKVFAPINSTTFFVCLGFIIICGIVGAYFGQKTLNKHFNVTL